jgi:hypothetical protein
MTPTPQELLDDVGPASLVDMGTLVADLGPRHVLQGAPFGTRVIVDVTGMRIEGPRADFSAPSRPGAVSPRFETGDERYAWLNSLQAVMKGRSDGRSLIAYRIYELA